MAQSSLRHTCDTSWWDGGYRESLPKGLDLDTWFARQVGVVDLDLVRKWIRNGGLRIDGPEVVKAPTGAERAGGMGRVAVQTQNT